MIIEILGWLGSFLLVLAYALTSNAGERYREWCMYLNLVGGIFIGINCFWNDAMPSFFTNVIWSFIAIVTILRTRQLSRGLKHKNKFS